MNYDYAWSELAALRALEPEAFPADVDDQLTSDCGGWFNSVLDDPDNIRDRDSLASMRHTAEGMGVSINEDLYESVEQEVKARADKPDHPDDSTTARFRSDMSPKDERDAIDAMFSHLSGSGNRSTEANTA